MVPLEDRYYPYRCSFDIETFHVPLETLDDTAKLQYESVLPPLSIGVCSNVPGFEDPRCFITKGDTGEIIGDMYQYFVDAGEAAYNLLLPKYQHILDELRSIPQKAAKHVEYLETRLLETPDDPVLTLELHQTTERARCKKRFAKLAKWLEKWLHQMVVLGFNDSRFDIPVLKSHLIQWLYDHDLVVEHAVRKEGAYVSLQTEHVTILDMCCYLAAGTSYDKWLKSFDVPQQKSMFPYEWLDDLTKLDDTALPPQECFYSRLRQSGISDEDYAQLQRDWKTQGCATMRDWLIYYMRLDTEPFLVAAQKMFDFWLDQGIDMFKSGAISLPGVAYKFLLNKKPKHALFPFFNKFSADWYHRVRGQVVGGPSLVFTRYHEVGETFIRDNPAKPTRKILGYDANR